MASTRSPEPPWILQLAQVGRSDGELAGGKGANLGELLQAGFPVPAGFVVTAPAYAAFAAGLRIEESIERLSRDPGASHPQLCDSIRARILAASPDAELAAAIGQHHRELTAEAGSGIVYAVRSSATAEDLPDASFAGQHGTYYYVTGTGLLEKIRQCWASLWSPEAVSYRLTHGIDHRAVRMAVVVQRMIPAEVSGVAFTIHPVTGDPGQLVIESSWGMGAAIVDGRVTPDRYVLRRPQLDVSDARIADKRYLVPAVSGQAGGPRLMEVPLPLRREPTLNDYTMGQVAQLSVQAERYFGAPQDVEWAILGDRCYMLQSRPVTRAGAQPLCRNEQGGQYVLFKPAVENFTEPLTPLGRELWKVPGFAFIGGRIYGDLAVWQKIIPLRLSNAQLADILYLSPDQARPRPPISFRKLPGALCFFGFYCLQNAVLFARTRRMPDDFMHHTRTLAEHLQRDTSVPLRNLAAEFLLRPKFFEPAGVGALAINLTSIRHWLWMFTLKRLVRRWAPGAPETAVHLLSSGSGGVLSAATGRAIWELAKLARASPRVAAILESEYPGAVEQCLRREPEARDFVSRLDRFLDRYGHRGVRELEPMAPRWGDDPAPVLGMVRNYLLADRDPEEHEANTAAARAAAERELRAQVMGHPLERQCGLRWRLIRHAAERTRYFMKLRENSRFYHILSVATLRARVLQIERQLLERGSLKCRDDVFFLYLDELDGLCTGSLQWQDVEDRIRERRMEYVRLSKQAPPRTVGLESAPPETAAAADDSVLHGQGASPGNYEGTARVILDAGLDTELHPGEILVAPYTDPAWTPLFLTAGAAVVEVGSFLSHAGTVAREYGMPCVVDLPGATTRIRSGDRLRVDGTSGCVQLLGVETNAPC